MLPVEIMHSQGTVVLRARNSELLILPRHVRELKSRDQAREFSAYFTSEALVNRAARKLFEGWLRKDRTVWPRLYRVIHKEVELADIEAAEELMSQAMEAKNTNLAEVAAKAETAKPEKKSASKPAKEKAAAKSVEKEPASKKKATAKKKTESKKKTVSKKTESKKTTTKKKTTKKAETKKTATKKTATKKTAAKKTSKKKSK